VKSGRGRGTIANAPSPGNHPPLVYNSLGTAADDPKVCPDMQTVNFNCPHCGNLMAVGLSLLGRNVRCPHCKQVVRAPAPLNEPAAPAPTPPPPPSPTVAMPSFNVPKPTETHESIFSERHEHDEDLFGTEPPKPAVPGAPPPPPPLPSRSVAPTLADTFGIPPSLQPSVDQPHPTPLEVNIPPPPIFEPLADDEADHGEPTREPRPEPEHRGYRAPGRREQAPSTPAFAWILLAYAAVVTVVAGFFGYQYFTAGPSADHPFKAIPDFYGEYEKANRRQTAFKDLPDPKLDVPPDLRVKLGDELTVGDLQVRPVSVERRLLTYTTEYVTDETKTREVGPATLVLTMKVKNVSTDTAFHPNDPAFNRLGDAKPLPYTALQVNQQYFYGPFRWPPDASTKQEYVVGQEWPARDNPVGPGQERDVWVTVAPSGIRGAGDAVAAIRPLPAAAPLLWRVQLRRGLVKAKDPSGRDVEVSATTVIGVEFRADQVK
jgi:hypothetical protein